MNLSLVDSVLVSGLDDWVPLLAVDGLAKQSKVYPDEKQRKDAVLDAVRTLLVQELMRAGDVANRGFTKWPGTVNDHVERIESALSASDPEAWEFVVWLDNTPAGDARAESAERSLDATRTEDPIRLSHAAERDSDTQHT